MQTGKNLYTQGDNVRIYMLNQYGEIIKASSGQIYAKNFSEFEAMVAQIVNVPPSIERVDKKIDIMLNTFELRENALKVGIFLGNGYMTSNAWNLIDDIADADIHILFVCPALKYATDSWAATLAKATEGLIIPDYKLFADDILQYIYGHISDVPNIPYNIITSNKMKAIKLKSELAVDGTSDTDNDSLTDWQEIRSERVIVNNDGSVKLPTYFEYMKEYIGEREWMVNWANRYFNLKNLEGMTIEEYLDEIYVLPVKSDPSLVDSDGDGISDYDETVWDGIDERYKNIGPLHKDTIETLFPEIEQNGHNKSSYPTYITVEDNDIVLHLRTEFTGNAMMRLSVVWGQMLHLRNL